MASSSNLPLVLAMLFLTFLLFFLTFFSSYLRRRSQPRHPTIHRPPTIPTHDRLRGLDPALIDRLPTFDYSAIKSCIALECNICLNEFHPHETLRLIPSCDHAFHVGCIDVWLLSHATCPVCRAQLNDLMMTQINPAVVPDPDSVAIHVADHAPPPRPKLARNLTWRNMGSGQPRLTFRMMRLARSKSTGRVAVKQWETMERFTLRLPEEVRWKIITGKVRRTTDDGDEGVVRRGFRVTGRGGSYGEERSWGKWVSSLTPAFFSRSKSMVTPATHGCVH